MGAERPEWKDVVSQFLHRLPGWFYKGSAALVLAALTVILGWAVWVLFHYGGDPERVLKLFQPQPATAEAIPDRLVAFFNEAECPGGWKPFEPASGRTLVGLRLPGELRATGGPNLPQDRPVRVMLQKVPAHFHPIPDIEIRTTAQEGAPRDGIHSHTVQLIVGEPADSGNTANTNYLVQTTRDPGQDNGRPNLRFTQLRTGTDEGTHTHNFNLKVTGKATSRNAGDAAVDVTFPFVMLTACEKRSEPER